MIDLQWLVSGIVLLMLLRIENTVSRP